MPLTSQHPRVARYMASRPRPHPRSIARHRRTREAPDASLLRGHWAVHNLSISSITIGKCGEGSHSRREVVPRSVTPRTSAASHSSLVHESASTTRHRLPSKAFSAACNSSLVAITTKSNGGGGNSLVLSLTSQRGRLVEPQR